MPDSARVPGLISIIIPTRDRRVDLAECLCSIERQDYANREVIVVDDCSEDDSADYVRANHGDVILIVNDRRRQPAYSRNLGLRAASGEWVLFLDSDSELPRPDWLSTMVRTLEAHPEVPILGGEIRAFGPRQDVAYGRNVRLNGATRAVAAPASEPEKLVACDYVATCNCFGRADAMQAAGGFDPYFGFGGEDVDFCLRVARGHKCCVSYTTAVHHKQSPRGRNPDETARYHLARVRQRLKNAPVFGVLLGLLYDLLSVVFFYLFLLPKLAAKLILRRPIHRENLTGGWLIVRAYGFNLLRLGCIRAARRTDFLQDEAMGLFEQHDTR